jgi:hypothetical protein
MFHEGDVPDYRPEMKPAPISEEKAVHDEVILLIIQKILDRCTRGDISAQTALMKVKDSYRAIRLGVDIIEPVLCKCTKGSSDYPSRADGSNGQCSDTLKAGIET